jgi:ABC-type polysaccharide/polyol phosphate transport system ATPase subunit
MVAMALNGVSKTFPHAAERMLLRGHLQRLWSRHRAAPFYALRDVSFTIEPGESVAVVGHNGAGKSTLLTLICGIAQPTSGVITVNGRIAALLELGSGFHPDLTGAENLQLNAALLGLNERETEEAFDAMVDFAGLREFINEPLRTYSTGMTVRLGFAVAVHTRPDIVIIDEVLAVGDLQFQHKCRDTLAAMKREGKTMLFVSHNALEVKSFCERALWLDHGRLRMMGPAAEVVDAYESNLLAPASPER